MKQMKGFALLAVALPFAISAMANPAYADNDEHKNKHDDDVVMIAGPAGP